MALVLCLSDFLLLPAGEWIVQQFINHQGHLHKVYVIGEEVFVSQQHSLPNMVLASSPSAASPSSVSSSVSPHISEGDKLCSHIFFNSQHLKNKLVLTEKETADLEWKPDEVRKVAEQVASCLRNVLQLHLFGFDMIREERSSDEKQQVAGGSDKKEERYYVVDVNHFPDFVDIDELGMLMRAYLLSKQKQK